MQFEEFINRTGKVVTSEEYHGWIEPLYMESDLLKDDFCRLFKEGAFRVQFPSEAEQTAFSSALDWGLDWRKARDTIRIIRKIANANIKRFSDYGLAYRTNDDRYDVSDKRLDGLQRGRDLYTSILDDLASWGGLVWYGQQAVIWERPASVANPELGDDGISFGR